jgi:two-component system phosphate regulon sensor histidine kinase PhoR
VVHLLAALAAGIVALGAEVPWNAALLVTVAAALPALLVRRRAGPPTDPRIAAAVAAEERRGDAARLLMLEMDADRSRSVLESLREGVLVVDRDGEIVLANPAVRHALQPGVEPLGKKLWSVLAPDLEASVRQGFMATGGDVGRRDPTFRVAAVHCGERVFDITAVRVHSRESGQDFGTAFLFVDVTRSHELAQLKDRFLSSISHEFRTPLTNICAYAEILRNLVPGESVEWPDFVRIIHEEGLQLGRLIDAVLDFLQLESGDAKFTPVDLDAVEVARAAFVCARQRAVALGIDLEFSSDPLVPHIVADRQRLAQVCDQLIDNGLKFTPRGGQVHVHVGELDGHPCLRIDDSGPGVPSGERQTVFEKFSQLRDHLTDKPTGAGLGLATCRAIVSRMGGLIWCEDSPFGGARFVVMFPRAGDVGVGPTERGDALASAASGG